MGTTAVFLLTACRNFDKIVVLGVFSEHKKRDKSRDSFKFKA